MNLSPFLNMLYFIKLKIVCVFIVAVWGGAKLADVLELIGIPKYTSSTPSGGKHVEFVSIDKCKVLLCLIQSCCWSLIFNFYLFPSLSLPVCYLLVVYWLWLMFSFKEENGGPYKASIPLIQATNPDADVLLAYEMNGEVYVLIIFLSLHMIVLYNFHIYT